MGQAKDKYNFIIKSQQPDHHVVLTKKDQTAKLGRPVGRGRRRKRGNQGCRRRRGLPSVVVMLQAAAGGQWEVSTLDSCGSAEFVAEPPGTARYVLHLEVVDRGLSGRGGSSSLSCEVDCLQPMKMVSVFRLAIRRQSEAFSPIFRHLDANAHWRTRLGKFLFEGSLSEDIYSTH